MSALKQSLLEAADVEHVSTTAHTELVFSANLPDANVGSWLQSAVEMDSVEWYDVRLLSSNERSRQLSGADS